MISYRTAIGLPGEPVAPLSRRGATLPERISRDAAVTRSAVSRLAAPRSSRAPHSDGHHRAPIGVSSCAAFELASAQAPAPARKPNTTATPSFISQLLEKMIRGLADRPKAPYFPTYPAPTPARTFPDNNTQRDAIQRDRTEPRRPAHLGALPGARV